MRLVSFGTRDLEQAGVLTGRGIVPVAALDEALPTSVRALLQDDLLRRLADRAGDWEGEVLDPAQVRLGPPVTDPGKIICIGLNYRGHAEEQDLAWPEEPLLFCKAPTSLAGCRDEIVLPVEEAKVDYEVELAVVIGKRGRHVGVAAAMEMVAGYMVAHDVSARRWQKADGQWFRAKSCDTFFPCGPALVTRDEVGDWQSLRLQTEIGGDLLQDALAEELIHGIPELIARISRDMTLVPGDIISTGTPAGVGCYRRPPRFLTPGDEVVCRIAGLGELRNPVVAGALP